MHDLKHFVENINLYKDNFQKRGSVDVSFDSILKLNEQRKELIQESEESRALVKSLSKQIDPEKSRRECRRAHG